MIYPANFEEKIGFDKIRSILLDYCISEMGISYIEKIKFSSSYQLIKKLLDQTQEFARILKEKPGFPSSDYHNLLPELERIKTPGTIISLEELFNLKSSMETISEIEEFTKKLDQDEFPNSLHILQQFYHSPDLFKQIHLIIDHKGEVIDKASSKLSELRKKMRSARTSIDGKIQKSLQFAKQSGWVNEDAEASFRDGRLVIPVNASHKNKLRGFIHDHSATGQTAFVEPEEVFQTNNEIRQLLGEEKQEIMRILADFTNILRPEIELIAANYELLGLVDFIRAKAKLAIRFQGIKPELINKPYILWLEARHPLLAEVLEKSQKKVVPLNLELNEKQRILVISGPNAGGKSVALKTIGLLQYMLQCGLLIPVKEGTQSGIFHHFFIDIGDEQSLENDLSTYSSHLLNMKHFSEKSSR